MRNVAVRLAAIVCWKRARSSSQTGRSSRRIDTRHGRADVDGPERVPCLGEEALGVGLDGQVGLCDRRPAELVGERPRALLAAVVVDEDARALLGERPRARGADAARRARHHDALPCEPRLHGASLCREAQYVSSDARRRPSASKKRKSK